MIIRTFARSTRKVDGKSVIMHQVVLITGKGFRARWTDYFVLIRKVNLALKS